MSIIFSDDINDNRGEDLHKRVDTIYDYIAYMKEQLEFWGRNRTRDITNADGLIATNTASIETNTASIEENADDITALSDRVDDNADDITALSDRVDDNADDITALGSRVTSLEALGYETGTNGNWTYRKWANGDYECWMRDSTKKATINQSWGSFYYGTISAYTYPITFVGDYPIVNITVQANNGGCWSVPDYSTYSFTSTGTIYVYRPSTISNMNITVNIYAHGKWK